MGLPSRERGSRWRTVVAALILAGLVAGGFVGAVASTVTPRSHTGKPEVAATRHRAAGVPGPLAGSTSSGVPGRPRQPIGRFDARRPRGTSLTELGPEFVSRGSSRGPSLGSHDGPTLTADARGVPSGSREPARMGAERPGSGANRTARQHAREAGVSLTPSSTKPYWACPRGACEAIVDPPPRRRSGHWALPAGGLLLEGSGELGGYDPQDLQSAYKVPTSGASTQTIALVDAYGYAGLEADLGKYRERYGLSSCTTANGCFRKVNEAGEEANYPSSEPAGWTLESASDAEMASAVCPSCHILVVEATSEAPADTGEAVNTAARLGATEISSSYGYPEEYEPSCGTTNCEQYSTDYNHPGVLTTAAAGDNGYDNHEEGRVSPNFPAASPHVVAVGGTVLKKASGSRGFSEEAWAGSGSGCSRSEPKPSWQTDVACSHRTDNDVAAVAACETPVSVYSAPNGEWVNVCGTSVGSPLVAAIEAHASEYARSLGAEAFYLEKSALFDITTGSNGECTPPSEAEYLCHAEVGYDGPTGNGTPDGALGLLSTPPSAFTSPASAVSGSAGTLNGIVDPNGFETTYHFEYGTTSSYGTSVPVPSASVGSGTSDQPVNQSLSALQANTVYHYRLVATSSTGTTFGADSAFKTAAPTVSGVQPATGPSDGGTAVTISGANFVGVTAVKFGSSEARDFKVESESSITAVSPRGVSTAEVTVTTPAGTSATSAADQFTFIVGPVLAWGDNGQGELGDGTTENRDTPVEVSALSEAIGLSGGNASLALLKAGTVMAWGDNSFGELGDGNTETRHVPGAVCVVAETPCKPEHELKEVVAIAAGAFHNLALLKDGTVLAWGDNRGGQLGTGAGLESDVPAPVCVALEAPCKPEHFLKSVAAIAAGASDSLALLTNGTVMAWGDNQYGQLGNGTSTGPETCNAGYPCSTIPLAVSHLSEVTAIAAGSEHNLALQRNGGVKAWGESSDGELGNGISTGPETCGKEPAEPCSTTPVSVSNLSEGSAIAAGGSYSLALLKNGTVQAWGANCESQLGIGVGCTGPEKCGKTHATPCSPVPVTVSDLSEVRSITAGENAPNSLAVLKSGAIESWGGNNYGQLGDGKSGFANASDLPVAVCEVGEQAPCAHDLHAITAAATGFSHDLSTTTPVPPTVTSVESSHGPQIGGTDVTINGNDFSGATSVKFGSANATSFTVNSDTSITAVSPPFAGGNAIAEVTVSTPGGTSQLKVGDSFVYEPTTSKVEPAGGPAGGGSSVTITGDAFEGHYENGAGEMPPFVAAVKFGQTKATSFEVISESEIKAVSPPGAGTAGVGVETLGGASASAPPDRFTYVPGYSLAVGPEALGAMPSALAANSEGDVWVSSWETGTVEELKENGELLRTLGALESPCTGSLEGPSGLAVDSSGDVWVADMLDGRIRKFSPEGKCLLQFGSEGSGHGQFKHPRGIAVDSHGNLWISDTGNDRIEELSGEGAFERQVGSGLGAGGELAAPGAVAIDSHGHVWVPDIGHARIVELGESGEYLGQIGQTSTAGCDSLMCLPMAASVDASGNVLVADYGHSRVDEFSEGGQLLNQAGSFGSGEGQFEWPLGVTVDPKGNLWVSDWGNGRLERWVGG